MDDLIKMSGWNGEEKSWFEIVNNIGRDIEVHARDEYDTFLEKCLEPWGITKENAYRFESRVRIDEENPHIEGFETVIYQRFYIDNKYKFTVVFKQTTAASGKYIGGVITTYEKVVEQDRLPKEEPMTNKEAIGYIKRIISGNSKPDMALKMAIEALEEQDRVPKGNAMTATKAIGILETVRGMSANSDEEEAFNKAIEALKTVDLIEHYQVPHNNYSGLFDKED